VLDSVKAPVEQLAIENALRWEIENASTINRVQLDSPFFRGWAVTPRRFSPLRDSLSRREAARSGAKSLGANVLRPSTACHLRAAPGDFASPAIVSDP
jgi:hypothetical protein